MPSDADGGSRFAPRFGGLLRSLSAFLVSMMVHLVLLIVLALWMVPGAVKEVLTPLIVDIEELIEEDLETVFLDESTEAATTLNLVAGGSPGSVGEPVVAVSDPVLDASILEMGNAGPRVSLDSSLGHAPRGVNLMADLPEGALGTARSIVDNYQQALDRITQEIMWMLSTQKVLVIWCFDQSESMKDDQQEIRDRIERVYAELGLTDLASGDALATAITSYGQGFQVHTQQPTSDLGEIRAAINSVPIDDSGEEFMCQAVGRSISLHRTYVNRTRRRMALILVTDESGNFEDNVKFLEEAIATAKSARCKVYVLGREAVFGYPYARMRWRHPQTNRPHWLIIDRGPETAFVEQLQTNGFRRRYDAFPSGYGPYEQSRLARQTGGIFFLLPSLETNLVRGEKRRYELQAMAGYRPDLRERLEIFQNRDDSELQMMIWGIVSDLNPYNKQSAKVIEMRVHFSPSPAEFVKQVVREQEKAKVYLTYLDRAAKLLQEKRRLRDDESSARWQANYDLLHAQLLAYKVRVYEYGSYLGEFVKDPKVVPLRKPPNLRLVHWDITTRAETLTGELTASTIDQANALFAEVIEKHPGTPWAARANWELRRGYGVELRPDYEPPYKQVSNPIPVPKL